MVKFYQRFLSRLKIQPSCKYYPTCSQYAVGSLEKHGAIKGSILILWRLLRCNPWSLGGNDPVPDRFFLYTMKNREKH